MGVVFDWWGRAYVVVHRQGLQGEEHQRVTQSTLHLNTCVHKPTQHPHLSTAATSLKLLHCRHTPMTPKPRGAVPVAHSTSRVLLCTYCVFVVIVLLCCGFVIMLMVVLVR